MFRVLAMLFMLFIPVYSQTISVFGGSYTGNGTSQTINVGFAPKMVMIKHDGTQSAIVRYSSHGADSSSWVRALTSDITNGIIAIGATGFTVGNSAAANSDTESYAYVAIGGDLVESFKYVGNGAGARNITSLSFTPCWAIVTPNSNADSWVKSGVYAGTLSGSLKGDTLNTAITALISGGISVNTTSNANLIVYRGIAINATADVTAFSDTSYIGNATDNRQIATPFASDFVLIDDGTGSVSCSWRTSAETADLAYRIDNVAHSNNLIQTQTSTYYEVGTNTIVNGSGDTFYGFAFRSYTAPATATKPGYPARSARKGFPAW